MWLRIIGKVNNGPNGIVVICQKTEMIIDFNELSFHFLSIIKNFGSTSSTTKLSANSINEKLLDYFESAHDDFNGIEVNSIIKLFPQYSVENINASLNFLLNEGHLYTTIDDKHLRSVNKGI